MHKLTGEMRPPNRLLPRRSHFHRRLANFVVRFAFQTNAMPQLKIEQSPDAIVVVATLRAMFVEKLLDCFTSEISAIQAPRFKQHFTNRFQSWSGEPSAPRCRKSQFWPVQNLVRQQILHRLLENPFAG